jgi:hypothetical protein
MTPMNILLQKAFGVVSQLPETEQNEIAEIIFAKLAEKLGQKSPPSTLVDFMQFAGIANAEERVILQNLEQEITAQRLLDLEREIEL